SDVHRDQPARADALGDHWILGSEAVPDVDDDTPRGQRRRHGPDKPAAGGPGLRLRSGPLPQPQVQPARRQRDETLGSDALVDPCGRVAPLADDPRDVPQMLAGPPRGPAGPSCQPQARLAEDGWRLPPAHPVPPPGASAAHTDAPSAGSLVTLPRSSPTAGVAAPAGRGAVPPYLSRLGPGALAPTPPPAGA